MSRTTESQDRYSIAEAEVLTGLSRATIYRKIACGQLKTIERGSRREIEAAELVRFINHMTHLGASYDV